MSDSRPTLGTVTARLEERILQPLRANAFARRTWFSVTVALVVSVYAGALAWMLWRDAVDPPKGASVQEAAVEVVPEMPKPPAPEPQPQPQQKQEAEKPATSAPRAFNDAKDDEHEDKETRAPKLVEKPADKPPEPRPVEQAARDPAEPPAAAPADKPEEAPPVEKKVEVPDKEAEALDKAPPEPPRKPQKLAQAKPTPPKPKPRPLAKSVAQQLAGASELPDFTFAKPMRKRAKVTGGTEDDRYLALVYGLITQNRRPVSYPYGDWAVAVSFVVDGGGNLVGAQISRSSGIPEVDSEAVAAVEEAAPFPPPPSGGNTGMVARLRSGSAQAFAGER